MDTTKQPEARWTRRKEARPKEILDAALKVFAAKGFSAARMEDIAREAGVTKGTIYLYFASKEAVFQSLVRESVGGVLDAVSETVRAHRGPVRDLLRFALLQLAELLVNSDRAVLPKIVIAEAGNFPELARFYRTEIVDRGLGLMTSLIARGIAQDEFRALPPEHVVRLCIAPVLLAAMWRSTFAQFDPEPYDYRGLIATHLDVLFRGLAPETTP